MDLFLIFNGNHKLPLQFSTFSTSGLVVFFLQIMLFIRKKKIVNSCSHCSNMSVVKVIFQIMILVLFVNQDWLFSIKCAEFQRNYIKISFPLLKHANFSSFISEILLSSLQSVMIYSLRYFLILYNM